MRSVVEKHNPYTCRLLRRLDWLWYRVTLRPVYWSANGRLCLRCALVHGVEARTLFPGWLYHLAARVQTRWPRTRAVLSW